MTTEAPVKSVKGSTFKGKNKGSHQEKSNFFKKDVSPYNDVIRYNPKTKEHILVKGLTEEEKVNEGSVPPLQYQNAVIETLGCIEPTRQIGRFEKTKHEREELKLISKKSKTTRAWAPPAVSRGVKSTLIVHLKNKRRGDDFKNFKTTYSFKNVAKNEISSVLSTIIHLDRDKRDDKLINHIVKYFFAGKTYHGKA